MPATIDGMLVDFDLIKRAQNGDAVAFNEVVLAYRKRILGTIARLIARPDDVEDVGQEVFLRLYFSLDQLRSPEVFEPWLYRLTVNAAYDYLRKQRRRQESRMADLSEQQVMIADAVAGSKLEHEDRRRQEVRETVEALLERLAALPLTERRSVRGLMPERAPTIVAGAAIAAEVMRAAGAGRMIVSERDILHGAALAAADPR